MASSTILKEKISSMGKAISVPKADTVEFTCDTNSVYLIAESSGVGASLWVVTSGGFNNGIFSVTNLLSGTTNRIAVTAGTGMTVNIQNLHPSFDLTATVLKLCENA